MATQPPQSLPSFAQTFGGPSVNRIPEMNNALPPIHHPRASPLDRSRSAHTSPQPSSIGDHKHNARKRLHSESVVTDSVDASGPEGRRSPRTVRVKQENENESIPPPSAATLSPQRQPEQTHTPPSSSASPNPNKKRRMTITSINTDVRRPSVDNGISPVVMGFTIRGDDPNALEQVRSMINLKQQQQALIEQRRESAAGLVPLAAPPDVNIVNPSSASDDQLASSSKPATNTRPGRSPNLAAQGQSNTAQGPRRSLAAVPPAAPPQSQQQPMSSSSRQPTPTPPTTAPALVQRAPTQPRPATDSPPTQPYAHTQGHSPNIPPPSHALPAPPISFARRRASRQVGSAKGKPSDILISPRTPQEGNNLQPIIQSAPPIPRAGQSQSLPGRFSGSSMALPSIPPIMGPLHSAKRISSGQVPPTPTRLAMARHSIATTTTAGISGRSPPAASIPIASTLVPPTPASLHHPGYTGEKSAFLAPFEMFYDALNDSKQLKTWLSEQLQKSNALMASLQRQQDQMEETVQGIVEKKVAAMRGEMYDLRVRVDELEAVLRSAKAQGYSPNLSAKGKGRANGYGASPIAPPTVPETYHFPPIDPLRRPEPVRRVSSPTSEAQSLSQTGSPVPFDVGKRMSISAIRNDPRPENPSIARSSISHPPRELPSHYSSSHSHPTGGGKPGWSPRSGKMSLPTSSARSSLSHSTLTMTSTLPERPGLTRRSSGQGPPHSHSHTTTRMHPPEKRRASRSPEADEEGAPRERDPSAYLLDQRRASLGSTHHTRARSPMDES